MDIIKNTIVLGFVMLGLMACNTTSKKPQTEEEKMKAYIEEHHPGAKPLTSGLYYIETTKGQGEIAKAGNKVSALYEGKLMDGTIFDSSFERNEPIEFVLGAGRVIPGWEEGLSKMRKGGEAVLVIPSFLAYGSQQVGPIPANSPLVFRIKLVDVQAN